MALPPLTALTLIIVIALAAAGVHVVTTVGLNQVIPNGTGKHVWLGPPLATNSWALGLFISEIAHTITLTAIKSSILTFYWRIFVFLVSIFQCVPTPDITWNFCSSIIWTNVEANIGIVCACLPFLKPITVKGKCPGNEQDDERPFT
ncbi:hypothetical protein LY76DRAFT_609652 [Colletotrichum caudatum]|nr:hypothetical protein LY76DRAFT_609652 [Colletotrichum caudatum]